MTRINCIPVAELTNQHAMAEYREIVRPFSLVRKAQENGINRLNFRKKYKVLDEYTLGTGHVVFFFDKLAFLLNRYHELQDHLIEKHYNLSPVSDSELTRGLRAEWFNDYFPTEKAKEINRARIAKRLSGDKTN